MKKTAEELKENKRKRGLRRYGELKLELFESKGGKCEHCGLRDTKHLEIYDYHHTDPKTKLFQVGSLKGRQWKEILEESKKCLLLCANCHRMEHARLRKDKYE